MICSSLRRLLRTTPPLGPEWAIVNGEVTFPLEYFLGGRSVSIDPALAFSSSKRFGPFCAAAPQRWAVIN
jgi:hypothetical protein